MYADNQRESVIKVHLSKGLSLIREGQKHLFIDYREAKLFQFNSDSSSCEAFDSQKEEESAFLKAQIDIYKELKIVNREVLSSNSGKVIYKIMKAPRALMTKIAGPRQLNYFGLTFRPGFTTYMVDQNHPLFTDIVEISDYNRELPGYHPLFEQLDPSLHASLFSGTPFEQNENEAVKKITFSLEREKAIRSILLSSCVK